MHLGCVAGHTLGSLVSEARGPVATGLFNAKSDAVLRVRPARFSTSHTTTQPLSTLEHEAHGHKLLEKREWGWSQQMTRSGGFHHQAALGTTMADDRLTPSYRHRHRHQHGNVMKSKLLGDHSQGSFQVRGLTPPGCPEENAKS